MAKQRTGDEYIIFKGMPTEYSLSDYWRWNASDLLNNTLRGSYCAVSYTHLTLPTT